MTTLVHARAYDAPFLYPLLLAVASALRGARRAWAIGRERQCSAKRYRAGIRDLHSMDDRQLADIGLSRCDVLGLARHNEIVQTTDGAVARELAFRSRAPMYTVRFDASPRALD